ncbi:MAG: hypothetical protein ACR2QS_02760 [Woeseiaceae bacterium]
MFAANAFLNGADSDEIVVSAVTINYLVEQREELLQRPITDAERQLVIDSHIADEVLVREARKLGLENNSKIRELLIQNMRLFLVDGRPEPSEEILREHYESHRERLGGEGVDYEAIQYWVVADWDRLTSQRMLDEAIAEMKQQYDIEFEDGL